ncbi:hypothetical protein [Sphingopyxis sp.]|uniref:hypothetical protein n=1 Tax=Sphingopyxis sp. TaxID=1908224 RepID=UPI00148570E2|nr:hypothetical protein [Sphingopyxis sp.]MBR2171556.1 hypothetical protein [Sphingopyxis sp.]
MASDTGKSAKNAPRCASSISPFPHFIPYSFYSDADPWQDQVEAFRRIAANSAGRRLGKASNYPLLNYRIFSPCPVLGRDFGSDHFAFQLPPLKAGKLTVNRCDAIVRTCSKKPTSYK